MPSASASRMMLTSIRVPRTPGRLRPRQPPGRRAGPVRSSWDLRRSRPRSLPGLAAPRWGRRGPGRAATAGLPGRLAVGDVLPVGRPSQTEMGWRWTASVVATCGGRS
jgi:hypothetical protein